MLKVLLKKQLIEVFKSFFYNSKKNTGKSKGAVIGSILLFAALMVGVLGGSFAFLAYGLCAGLVSAGMGWLYFVITGGISVLMGTLGSVFTTYSGLYLSKDNDLLLSMPVPVKDIVVARLLNVWLLGAMYSAIVFLPALIVYWIFGVCNAAAVLCDILMMLLITLVVMILSCLLGWVVAKISLKLKNKSFVTVALSILGIGLYYFLYFKAQELISDIILNAAVYGEKLRGAAYPLYLFGRIGEGDWLGALVWTGAVALLLALTWLLLKKTFLAIAISSGKQEKKRGKVKDAGQRTPSGALLAREFKRFSAKPGYMLNCGLGILLIPVAGILLLTKGADLVTLLQTMLAGTDIEGYIQVVFCALLCTLTSMINPAAPSVSLEGKTLWLAQSLPVEPKSVLRAKSKLQLLLTAVPVLFVLAAGAIVIPGAFLPKLLMLLAAVCFTLLFCAFCGFCGVRMANLTWTNELVPVKQSGAVAVPLFAAWGAAIVFGGLYFLVGRFLGPALYLAIWTALFAAGAALLFRWLDTKGAKRFAAL